MSDERIDVKFYDKGFGVMIKEGTDVHIDYRNTDGTHFILGTFHESELPKFLRAHPNFVIKMTMDEFELLAEWLILRKSEDLIRSRKNQTANTSSKKGNGLAKKKIPGRPW